MAQPVSSGSGVLAKNRIIRFGPRLGIYRVGGILEAQLAQGLRVPKNAALAGFSHETFTSLTEPNRTFIDQRREQMDQAAAVRFFLKTLAEDVFLPCRIVL